MNTLRLPSQAELDNTNKQSSHETIEVRIEDTQELLHRFRPLEGQYTDQGQQLFADRRGKYFTQPDIDKILKNLQAYKICIERVPTQNYRYSHQTEQEQLSRMIKQYILRLHKDAGLLQEGNMSVSNMVKSLNKVYALLYRYVEQ